MEVAYKRIPDLYKKHGNEYLIKNILDDTPGYNEPITVFRENFSKYRPKGIKEDTILLYEDLVAIRGIFHVI